MANKKIIHGESKTQVKNNVQKPKKNGRGHKQVLTKIIVRMKCKLYF